MVLNEAVDAMKRGEIVLLYDDDTREKETNMVIGGQFVEHDIIKLLRKEAGGIICLAIPYEMRRKMNLLSMTEIYEKAQLYDDLSPKDLQYDDSIPLSITINSRRTFTGVTDRDRARTIADFVEMVKLDDFKVFGRYFRSPGHMPILIGTELLVSSRKGHTELSLALAKLAEIMPVAVFCEMLANDGDALKKEDAISYAKDKKLVFIEGKEIVEGWKRG